MDFENMEPGKSYTITTAEFIELRRQQAIQTRRDIVETSRGLPDHLDKDTAETICYRYGRDHMYFWLVVNRARLDNYDFFWLALDAYTMAPYKSIPKSEIIALRKIRPGDYLRELDPAFLDVDPVPVFRGGQDTERDAKNALSWTTDPVTAIFFYWHHLQTYNETGQGLPPVLWAGNIYKDKIIGTENGRSEKEIIQHGSVRDLRPVPLTDEQTAAAMDAFQRQKAEHEKEFFGD